MVIPSCKTAALNAGLGKGEINKLMITRNLFGLKVFNK